MTVSSFRKLLGLLKAKNDIIFRTRKNVAKTGVPVNFGVNFFEGEKFVYFSDFSRNHQNILLSAEGPPAFVSSQPLKTLPRGSFRHRGKIPRVFHGFGPLRGKNSQLAYYNMGCQSLSESPGNVYV